MKLTVVNFADNSFKTQQRWNTFSAKLLGRADKVISYSPDDIKDYLDAHPEFFKYKKGYGNYFWKPYVILKALDQVSENDFLFYSDSGSVVLRNLRNLCRELVSKDKDIMVFRLPLIEKQWTKNDCIVLMDAKSEEIMNSSQCLATFILIKKTSNSVNFIEEYCQFCTNEQIVSDMPNKIEPNFSEFLEHRHDQSVLSILAKKSNHVLIEQDLSDYGIFPEKYLSDKRRLYDPAALDISRVKFKGYVVSNRKEHPLRYLVKYFIKRIIKGR